MFNYLAKFGLAQFQVLISFNFEILCAYAAFK